MRILFSLWVVFSTLTSFGDEGLPKQHISTANADNLAVAINPGQTHALVVGRRFLSPTAPLNISVGTIELVKLSNGLSDPAFHEALDVGGNILRDGDPAPGDAGVIYVNASKSSYNTDCFSVAWVNDNEAWALCKQPIINAPVTNGAQPLFLVRIKPNEADKVKVFRSNIGVGGVAANKLYNNSGSNSLMVDGNYLIVGGKIGSSSTDQQSFLAKFLLSSVPQANSTTGAIADWAPETMVKYGISNYNLVNYGLSGLAKATIDGSNYYLTLNRQVDGKYFLGKHNASDLTDSPTSSGVVPGFFSAFQLPNYDMTKMKLNAVMANGSNLYLAGSYDDKAVIVALNGDGTMNTNFNSSSPSDSAGVLRLKPVDQIYRIKGADENILFGKAELNGIRATSNGGMIGLGAVSYTPPLSVKFSEQAPYYGGLVVELDSTASSTPLINAHVGAPYDWNSTYYRSGEMVGSRLVAVGYKQFFVSAATTGGFYQSFNKGASGYLPNSGIDSCVVVLPKKKFKPSEMRKEFKLFINEREITEPAAGALGYLDSNFSEKIGRRSFGRNSERGVTTLNPAQLSPESCTTDRCSYSESAIRFILGGKSAYKVACNIRYRNEQNAEVDAGQEIELGVEVNLPVLRGEVTSSPSDKAQNPVVKVNSTESGNLNFFSDSACLTPFASPGSSAINAGQDLSIAVGSIQDNVDTQIYAQATSSAGSLKSGCVLVGSYRRDLIAPAFESANLLTESPNKTLRPSIGISGYNESSQVSVGVFSDANCLASIDVERTVPASALNSFRIENGINANSSNALYVRLADLAGNRSDCKPAGVFVNDTIAPVIGRFRINNGASSTTSRIVDLILNGSSDAVAYCLANADAGACSSDQSFTLLTSSNLNYLLSDGFGNKTLVAKLRDQAGNVSEVGTAQISYVDNSTTTTTTVTSSSSTTTTVTSSSSTTTTVTTTTLPDTTPRIVANNGEQYTNQTSVSVKLSAYGAIKARVFSYNCSGRFIDVNLTNGQTSETTWRVYSPGRVNIVYGQFYYPNGRVSACLGSNPFTQDSQGPHLHTPRFVGGATQGASNAAEVPATFSYYAHDANPIVGVRYGSQGCSSNWIALSPSKAVNNQITVAIPRTPVSSTSSFYFQVKDIAGNESACIPANISYPRISYFLRQNYTSSIINTRLWAYGNRVVSMSVSQSPDCGGTSAVFENFSYYPSYPVPRGMNAAQIRLYARVRDTSGFESLCVPMR